MHDQLCMYAPNIRLGDASPCRRSATHVYAYIGMALCEQDASTVRGRISRFGHDPYREVIDLEDFTGVLANDVRFVSGAMVGYHERKAELHHDEMHGYEYNG
jgi:hypothetical protein